MTRPSVRAGTALAVGAVFSVLGVTAGPAQAGGAAPAPVVPSVVPPVVPSVAPSLAPSVGAAVGSVTDPVRDGVRDTAEPVIHSAGSAAGSVADVVHGTAGAATEVVRAPHGDVVRESPGKVIDQAGRAPGPGAASTGARPPRPGSATPTAGGVSSGHPASRPHRRSAGARGQRSPARPAVGPRRSSDLVPVVALVRAPRRDVATSSQHSADQACQGASLAADDLRRCALADIVLPNLGGPRAILLPMGLAMTGLGLVLVVRSRRRRPAHVPAT